jgi:hypothetical protein
MKKGALVVCVLIQCLGCGTAFGLDWASLFPELERIPFDAHLYVSLEGEHATDLFTSLRSGGYNTLGRFSNQDLTTAFHEQGRWFGRLVGLELACRPLRRVGLGYLRVDWGTTFSSPADDYNFRTGSFPGSPPFFFFYRTKVARSASRGDLYSVYYQQPLYFLTPIIRSFFGLEERSSTSSSLFSQFASPVLEFSVYAGVGRGRGKTIFVGSTYDLVVTGGFPPAAMEFRISKREYGVELKLTECVSLYWARRVYTYDMSETTFNMPLVFFGFSGGNYTLGMASDSTRETHDFLGFRFRL